MDELSAAVAHQLNEPLTALLIYLHEVGQVEHLAALEALPLQVQEIVGKAICDAERVCTILERMRQGVDTQLDTQSAIARAREAIDTLARISKEGGGGRRQLSSQSVPALPQRPLTAREREVLAQITGGASNKEGSLRLQISTRTFEVHRAHIMSKLGARNAADLVRVAMSEGK